MRRTDVCGQQMDPNKIILDKYIYVQFWVVIELADYLSRTGR